jgi:hypothetical protein
VGTAANRAQAPARGAVPDGSTALLKAASLLRAMVREDHARRTTAATPDTTQDAPWPRGTYSPARPPCRPPPAAERRPQPCGSSPSFRSLFNRAPAGAEDLVMIYDTSDSRLHSRGNDRQ